MSDHIERACTYCGSLLHHEDDCAEYIRALTRTAEHLESGEAAETCLNDVPCQFHECESDIRYVDGLLSYRCVTHDTIHAEGIVDACGVEDVIPAKA